MKSLPAILFFLLLRLASGQDVSNNSKHLKYVGKYALKGMVIQVAENNGMLVLIVPGAPFQELIPLQKNVFKTSTFGDEIFTFVEENGEVEQMVSQRSGRSVKLKKVSNLPDDFNKGDEALSLRKKTEHFY